jgi:hypothetical protein
MEVLEGISTPLAALKVDHGQGRQRPGSDSASR